MNIKNQFPIYKSNPKLIYLDSTATTLKPKVVIDKIEEGIVIGVDTIVVFKGKNLGKPKNDEDAFKMLISGGIISPDTLTLTRIEQENY